MPQDGPRRPQDAPKTSPRRPKKPHETPQEAPKRPQLGQLGFPNPRKSMKNRCRDAIPFWLHFLIHFCPILFPTSTSKILKKLILAEVKPLISTKSLFEVDIDLLSDVGANLRPLFCQNPNKILLKINLQRHQVPDLSVGALPMPQGGPQDDPEGLKTPLLALQDSP